MEEQQVSENKEVTGENEEDDIMGQKTWTLCLPNANDKKYSLIGFQNPNLDFTEKKIKLGRQNNYKPMKKERKLPQGKYNAMNEPWTLTYKVGKKVKKFIGKKQGTTDNASYFAIVPPSDSDTSKVLAIPLEDWYSFKPVQKTSVPTKSVNEFIKKGNLSSTKEKDQEEKDKKKQYLPEVSEFDEASSDENDSSNEMDDESKKAVERLAKKAEKKDSKKREFTIQYVLPSYESDDSEQDYPDEPRKESESEEEDEDDIEEKRAYDYKEKNDMDNSRKFRRTICLDDLKNKENNEQECYKSSSDSDTDSLIPPQDKKIAGISQPVVSCQPSTSTSDVSTPAKKRVLEVKSASGLSETNTSPTTNIADSAMEDTVRQYLLRKPMTTKDLLQKMTSKYSTMKKDQVMHNVGQILKRLNPEKAKVNNKLYLFIKKAGY